MEKSELRRGGGGKKIHTSRYIIYYWSGCVYTREMKYVRTLSESQLQYIQTCPVKGCVNKAYIDKVIGEDFVNTLPPEEIEDRTEQAFLNLTNKKLKQDRIRMIHPQRAIHNKNLKIIPKVEPFIFTSQ